MKSSIPPKPVFPSTLPVITTNRCGAYGELLRFRLPWWSTVLRARYGSNRSLVVQLLSIHGYAMYVWEQPEPTYRTIEFIRDGVSRGLLRPLVGKRFTLDQIVTVMTFLDSMEQIEMVVVTNRSSVLDGS